MSSVAVKGILLRTQNKDPLGSLGNSLNVFLTSAITFLFSFYHLSSDALGRQHCLHISLYVIGGIMWIK